MLALANTKRGAHIEHPRGVYIEGVLRNVFLSTPFAYVRVIGSLPYGFKTSNLFGYSAKDKSTVPSNVIFSPSTSKSQASFRSMRIAE